MGRSGYGSDDCEGYPPEFWQQAVRRAIKGARGQTFLQELARAMDAMPVKRLIANDLITPEGECCTMGVVMKARGLDVSNVDAADREQVAALINVAPSLAAEIAYLNDDDFGYETRWQVVNGERVKETPEERWTRMRAWVDGQLGVAREGGGA